MIEQFKSRVIAAAQSGTPLVLRGGGSKSFLGREPQGEVLDLSGHAGIVDYDPTELVVTARGGTPLSELEAALAARGQWLAFEPPHFGPRATVGGMVAAGLSGPGRAAAGAVRDFLLGVKLMDGRGEVHDFGGRVMKNVAGYDVSRLMAGAMGTLGVLLELSLKTLPRPPAEATLVFELPEARAIETLNRWGGQPLPVSASTWCGGLLHVRLSGATAAVQAARAALGGQSLPAGEAAGFWQSVREQTHEFFAGEAPLWRLSLPSTAKPPGLAGPLLIEWGGALRWLRSGADAASRIAAATVAARCSSRSIRCSRASTAISRPNSIRRASSIAAGCIPGSDGGNSDMQTNLAERYRGTPEGEEAEAILRKCVHCGFCTATCPTYQLLGDELDGPRGRIYLIKQVLEGVEPTAKTQSHLDRCLTCRSCETTCPSGVQYGRLADIGRKAVEERVGRGVLDALMRHTLATVLPRPGLFGPLAAAGRAMKPLLPAVLAEKLPASPTAPGPWPAPRHARRMVALAGCVQPALTPDTNAAAARVLDRIGISLVEAPGAGCCGALRYHLNFQEAGLADMRRLIDAWWPLVEQGAEAFVMTASGCGAMVREFGHLLARDPAYAQKAARISAMTRDLLEVLAAELDAGRLDPSMFAAGGRRVAFHAPCTLQHGQKLKGLPERLLARLGFDLAPVPDSHLCCGSAGTYSLLQPELSARLKSNKLEALASGDPELILTANIGCQTHLAAGAARPVKHWVVALDELARG